jgi:oligopeptide transport system substrate-binding protein
MRTTDVMRARERVGLAVTACAFVLLGAACGGGASSPGDSEGRPPTGAAARGGTLTAQLTEPTYLAPAQKCYESECAKVLNLVNDKPVSVDLETGDLVFDGLLESIQTTDNKVFTIKIRPNRKFHNGEPVDADAFIRAWNYSADPENETETTGFLSKIEGYGEGSELAGVRKIDDLTIEVTLTQRFALFPVTMSYSNAFAPMAQECFDDLKACNEQPIGTGAYQMDGPWQHSQGVTVKRWPGYQGEATSNPDTIDLHITTDLVAAFRAFQAGQIDITELDPTIYQEAQAQYPEQVMLSRTGNLDYMGFPTKTAPWNEPKMRQAISMAFDRQLIIDQVLNGVYEPPTAIAPPAIPGSQQNACDFCQYDPQRAKQLFQQAGGEPGMTVDLWFNAGAGHDGWVEAIGNQLKQNLGVEFKLQPREWAQYLEILEAGDFTGPFRLGWLPDYPATENYLRPIVGTGGDSNYQDYSNPQVDSLLDKGDQAVTEEQATQLYQQAEDVALQDLPILPLWVQQEPTVYASNLSNVSYNVSDEVPLNEVVVNQ